MIENKSISCDVDLDFADRSKVLELIKHVPASMDEKGVIKKHSSGVYCHTIPVNPLSGHACIDYKTAAKRGYFKLDFLNVSAYADVKNDAHMTRLLAQEPIWELLSNKDICDQLVHVNGYHSLIDSLKPTSITELAIVLALIRPGKRHLIPTCKEHGFLALKDSIWVKSDTGYHFKKSHSFSYSTMIVMQLNLLVEQLTGHSV